MIRQSELVQNRIARSFANAVSSYDESAELQRWVGEGILNSRVTQDSVTQILDVGTGTGFCAASLAVRYPEASVVALDLVHEMLQVARHRLTGTVVQGHAACLPFRSDVFDLVVSNLCIQWCHSPGAVLKEWFRALRPGGQLFFSTLGPQTLQELRAAWSSVDQAAHVIDFHEAASYAHWLKYAGFDEISLERRTVTRCYPDVLALLRELKGLGARNASSRQSPGLTGRNRLSAMMQRYQADHGRGGDKIPATFEVLTFVACSPRVTL